MSDNLKRKKPEDPTKINVNQTWEVQYWTEELGITETRLKAAVKSAGVLVADVKAWLKKN